MSSLGVGGMDYSPPDAQGPTEYLMYSTQGSVDTYWTYGWMDGRKEGWINGWMEGWINGWMHGRMDKWMDGWLAFLRRQPAVICLRCPFLSCPAPFLSRLP